MTRIQTIDGQAFDLLSPDPGSVDINVIAHALAHLCRFTGHVTSFDSVAQHSVAVADILRDQGHPVDVQLAGLMHDATEAYVGDVARPLKRMLPEYEVIEARVWAAIATRFRLPAMLPEVVKVADNISLYWERRDLLSAPPAPWQEERYLAMVPTVRYEAWSSEVARRAFLARYNGLTDGAK